MAMLEFPKFFGEDVKGWVFRCEQFFLLEQTSDADKVTLISIYLYDKALLWHSQFMRIHETNVGWEVYKKEILERFGNVYEDPMSELKNLKYETTAREYEDAFDSLLSRVEINKDHAVSLFMRGIPTEIEMGVRMFKPKTLADAYCLTNLKEATLNVVKKKELHSMDVCVFPRSASTCIQLEAKTTDVPLLLQQVIEEYEDVFAIPKEL
uniref:Putative mitochondrial protein n=1 Tax=Tanacetum cinerariifolium TaxID=118510 RepID=A0A6L2K5U2_TANCI|nr:putative mitochondrial protein [Tanacetum cinerariifolium]